MSYSINFNGNDLSTHKLVITSLRINKLQQLQEHVQLQNKGYAFIPKKAPRYISLDCAITGSSRADLDSNLDSIKEKLVTMKVKQLKVDALTGRYFNAMLEQFDGHYLSPILFIGTLEFVCPDPLGYDNTETSSDFNIDADPDTVEEETGGTGYINPVYTLTAGEALTDVTIKVECIETGEELQWIGSLANGEQLEINVATWLVKKEGSASMATVTGQFPRLLPGTTNRIKVTGFSTTGTLNITYRNTYL